MNRPLPPFPRPIPDDQIHVGYRLSPDGRNPVAPRRPDLETSYRHQHLRLWPAGSGGPIDLVSHSGGPKHQSDAPAEIFGAGAAPLILFPRSSAVPGSDEDREATADLFTLLDAVKTPWTRASRWSPTLDWAQPGALLVHPNKERIVDVLDDLLPVECLEWTGLGLGLIRIDASLTWLPRSSVEVRKTAPGCPLRSGADDFCTPWGGPWTSQSRVAFGMWQRHRKMLTDALGCRVCDGGPVNGGDRQALTLDDGRACRGPARAKAAALPTRAWPRLS